MDYLTTQVYKPITNTAWVRARLCKLQKGCTRLAAASDRVTIPVQLVHGRWFSPGTPASSTTKTGRHDIAEISLKVALGTKNQPINRIYLIETSSARLSIVCIFQIISFFLIKFDNNIFLLLSSTFHSPPKG